jgi:hypothetical protein
MSKHVSLVVAEDLAAQIVGLSGRLSAALCRWLLLIAQLDEVEGGYPLGFASTSSWLAYACGLSKRAATDHVRAARALASFPALVESMTAGRLSYSHLRAISRIAKPGETQLVDDLIMVAEHGTVAHLEVIVRGLQTVDDTTRSTGEPNEYVRGSWTDQSQWRLAGRLDPEKGAVIESALKSVAAAAGISEADALVLIAEQALAELNDANRRRRLRGDERAAVVIHLNADRGERIGSAEPNSRPAARIADGPGLPDRVVQRLLCSGRIRTALCDRGGNVLDLGRSQRLVSDKQYRALLIRDHGHCAHPGCTNRRNLDAHHVINWLDGGRTDMNNLILLCEPHHLGLHNGEFSITATGNQQFRFARADGVTLPNHVNPTEYITTDRRLETEHPNVPNEAATTRWDGQRLDHDYAISVLAQRRESAA